MRLRPSINWSASSDCYHTITARNRRLSIEHTVSLVKVQFLVVLEIANSCLTPVPEPLNGSGKGASRTDNGVRSIKPLPPVHASGSLLDQLRNKRTATYSPGYRPLYIVAHQANSGHTHKSRHDPGRLHPLHRATHCAHQLWNTPPTCTAQQTDHPTTPVTQ